MDGAAVYAYGVMRKKAEQNPCLHCEQVDCEGCEFLDKRLALLEDEQETGQKQGG